jgi:hypothetical protein
MSEKTFLVSIKGPIWAVQPVVASTVEIFDEHLCFTNAKGELAALFLLDTVRSWNVCLDRP